MRRSLKWQIGLIILGLCFSSIGAAGAPLSLEEAVKMALDHNFGVKAAQHDSAAAASRLSEAQSDRYPVLSLAAKSYYVSELQKMSLSLPAPMYTLQRELGSHDNYQADFTLSLPLFTGGRIGRRIALETENASAGMEQLASQKLATAYQCRRQYLNLVAAQAVTAAAQASLERLHLIQKDVQNMYDNGMADSLDILDAVQALKKGTQLVDEQETARQNSWRQLAQSIGIEDSSALSVIDNVPLPAEPHYARPTTADITRPELARLDHVVAAAENAAALSSAAYFPTLGAFGGYSIGMPNKDMFGKTWNDYFSAGLSLNWDFNVGGKTSKTVATARQTASSARMTRAKLQDDLLLQSTVAHNNLTLAYNNCRTAADEFDIAQRKFNLARQKQREGNLSLNRLLEQEADLTATEQQYRAAVVRYFLAETDYLYAVGSIRLYGGLQ